jgi:hypothetical protein
VATQTPPPFRNLCDNITEKILSPATGGLGGTPPTPQAMDWLWPVAGADENKVLVASDPDPGQVGLMEKLNGTQDWIDPTLTGGQTFVRAVHFNELRQAIEWITRGRWRLPVYLGGGIWDYLPDVPSSWDAIANRDTDELRSVGFVIARTADTPALGLINLSVRSTTGLDVTADTDCQVAVYHCLREIDFAADPPTWNEYDPSASAAWATPGGTGSGDATYIGSLDLTATVTAQLSNPALTSAVQAMIDGAEQNFLLRRSDTGPEKVGISAEAVVEFDLDSPPN